MNINKRKISILLVVIITILICLSACFAYAETIEKYEDQIESNTIQMAEIEEIKKQLHITAEMLRHNDYINNGLDEMLSQKWHDCNNYQLDKAKENTELQDKINTLKKIQHAKKYVGDFKITHYCPCRTCNGNWGNKTALGTIMTPYRTIAVDPKVIPLGSKVEINGNVYIAEDTGGAIKGNRIDVCVASHAEAYRRGVLTSVPVYIINE